MNIKDMLHAMRVGKETSAPTVLDTPWGESLDTNHILEQYPRPQLVRKNFEILNGYWRYAITPLTCKYPEHFDGLILVPFSPESPLSGVSRHVGPEEYLWYERILTIPKHSFGTRQILHFEAVDQCACVFINGHKVSRHVGGYLPFEIDLTPFLTEGVNHLRLTVRVQDLSDTSWHSRGKQKQIPGGMFYTAQSGIWQTVWMETVPEKYISSLELTPNPDKKQVTVTVHPNHMDGTPVMHIRVFEPNRQFDADQYWNPARRIDTELQGNASQEKCAEPAILLDKTFGTCTAVLDIPDIRSWSPKEPWLYPVEITVGTDTVHSYFAMRCFTIEIPRTKAGEPPVTDQSHSRICLNHTPIFLNGVLDQGYWPDGLYTAPADEALIYDIQKMKQIGFNMIRKHAKIECRRWYYHCDRLGMIVWQDMVNGGYPYSSLLLTWLPTLLCVPGPIYRHPKKPSGSNGKAGFGKRILYAATGRQDARGRREFLRECRQTVQLLKVFPSIMAWVPFNEGWGQFDTDKVEALIRRLDSQRLIDISSGWFDRGGGDFKSVHNYFYKLKPVQDRRPYMLSEYGGYVLPIPDHHTATNTYGYRSYDSAREFEQAFCRLMLHRIKPLIHKGLCGAVYTQVSDIEEEVNGLLTYDRKICKLSDTAIKKIQRGLRNETQL